VNRSSRHLLFCLAIASGSFPAAAQSNALIGSTNAGQAAKPFTFEVVSIRPHAPGADRGTDYLPDGYRLKGLSLGYMIDLAYMAKSGYMGLSTEVRNGPAWLYSELYDLDARVAPEDQAAWQKAQNGATSELVRSGVLAVLQDRAKLAVHITEDQKPCLDLTVGSHGARLNPTVPGAVKIVPGKTSKLGDGFAIQQDGSERFVGVTMTGLASRLARAGDWKAIVQDKTGLTGRYDFTLPFYSQDPDVVGLDRMPISGVGLVLKPGKAPITVINIDHIERPDAN
jgi:uncharacterized protein (TIGR03435 family)